jgi:hypothetical protein
MATPLIGQLAWAGDAPPSASSNRQALWSTPGDGQLVMLMRSGAFYDAQKPGLPAVPLRVRVCVTNMTGSNNSVNLYVWTTEGPLPNLNNNPDRAPPANQPQTLHMQLGQCVDLDRPGGIIVQDSTVSGTSSGYYELFEETSLLRSAEAAEPLHLIKHGNRISYGPPKNLAVRCSKLPKPTKDFWASCEMDLGKDQKATRVCTADKFVQTKDGLIDYPASLLELVVDKNLLVRPKISDYDYNWTPVTQMGCRDFVGVSVAYFMVGPKSPEARGTLKRFSRSASQFRRSIGWNNAADHPRSGLQCSFKPAKLPPASPGPA